MIVLIDNYDSFTYNLVQKLGEVSPGALMKVFRNDKVTVDYTDPHSTYMKGHFAIQAHDPKSKVWVRKIEVKELPAGKP